MNQKVMRIKTVDEKLLKEYKTNRIIEKRKLSGRRLLSWKLIGQKLIRQKLLRQKLLRRKPLRRKPLTVRPLNLLVLIFLLIMIASISTYVVPAGKFDVDAKGVIVAGTYSRVPSTPVSPWRALCMIFDGMTSGSFIISVILLMGGCISAILATGAVEHLIDFAMYRLQQKKISVLVPCCMILMSLLASFGGSDAFVAFVAVGVVFAHKLRLDPISAVAVFFFSTFVGFFSGPFIMSVQIIAGVKPFSGFAVRLCVLLVMTGLACLYTVRYCRRVSEDPANSLMGHTRWLADCSMEQEVKEVRLDWRALTVVLLLVGSFIGLAVLMPLFHLGYGELIGILILVVIVSGFIYGKTTDEIASGFAKGVASMTYVALVVGMARTISLVLEKGNVLPSMIQGIIEKLSHLPAGIAAVMLFLSNSVINVAIPSCSGQAAIVLPVMMPIGRLLGIPDQVVVSAFVYGDGLTNLCIPTFAALMGALSIAKVPFGKWMRFILPFIGIAAVLLSVLLIALTAIGWTG